MVRSTVAGCARSAEVTDADERPPAERDSPDQQTHATIPSARAAPGRERHDARRSLLVVTAYILIQTEVGKAAQVAKDIVEIKACSRPRM
jgi:hypothetical protein